jgi:hypothetical protein
MKTRLIGHPKLNDFNNTLHQCRSRRLAERNARVATRGVSGLAIFHD